MLRSSQTHRAGLTTLLAILFVLLWHTRATASEWPALPIGLFAPAALDEAAPAGTPALFVPSDPLAEQEAPLVTRSFVAILAMTRPQAAEPVPGRIGPPAKRPAVLPALYASFAALQALDLVSTRRGLAAGAREANPLMRGVAGSGAGLLAIKAGAAAGTIVLAEKLWRRNRAAAIGAMIALNATYAVVVSHNQRVLGSLK